MNNYFTDPHWETVYICSVCGEHSSTKSKECPFCHHEMQNYEGSITLCENRCKDKCGEFCDGWDTTRECYIPCGK